MLRLRLFTPIRLPSSRRHLFTTTSTKMASSSSRTYADALARLSLLQSNRAVTSLFTADSSSSTKDLNALAIPEMLAWLARAGYTPSSLYDSGIRVVHVAGTKGKGSVAAQVASIIEKATGRKVGLYTSPHVVSVRERIRINGVPVSREVFGRYFFEVWDRLSEVARREGMKEEDVDGAGGKPFYFRFLTILGVHVFVSEGVKDVVLECGIGGEYDATNVVDENVVTAAVVTQLGLDHVGMLGDTVEKIAWNKAGVFKRGVKGFTRRLDGQPGVMRVLRERAEEKGALLVEVGDEVVQAWEGVEGARLRGPFQKDNMALAVGAAREHLIRTGVEFEGEFGKEGTGYAELLASMPDAFQVGLREASLRGRSEIFTDGDGVRWFLDGAHTDDSLAGVSKWFAQQQAETDDVRVLLFNQQERDVATLLGALLRPTEARFTHAIFTRNEETPAEPGSPRDMAVQNQAAETFRGARPDTAVSVTDSVSSAVEQIKEIAVEAKKHGKGCVVLATGSFHLVGAVLRTIDHESDDLD
ncbi:folC protein [Echria macrotheca]|uniref:Folylpolyglutamate synthase n=1 Tax=Echria macrotheca TaxID=438768 RepID=A0AAJ0B6I2_9PEZI|nr:folC protein [Echria macrotheca]